MKPALIYSLYLEVAEENYPSKYSGIEIMDYAVRRLGGSTEALPSCERELQYEELRRLYDLTYDQIETLFVPYKMYGLFPQLIESQRLDTAPYGVYPSCFNWDYYREAWLAYFPGWFVLWGWHSEDFCGCAYWVLSVFSEGEIDSTIFYGLKKDAYDTLKLMELRYPRNSQILAESFDSRELAKSYQRSVLPESKKVRPVIEFGL